MVLTPVSNNVTLRINYLYQLYFAHGLPSHQCCNFSPFLFPYSVKKFERVKKSMEINGYSEGEHSANHGKILSLTSLAVADHVTRGSHDLVYVDSEGFGGKACG